MDRLNLSDERLMALASVGDRLAFEALVRRVGPVMLTLAVRMLGDQHRAEEAFVDAVTNAWLGRKTYLAPRSVQPWLLGITANAVRDCRRRRNKKPFSPPAVSDGADNHGQTLIYADAPMEEDELVARLNAAISKLPERQRETLVLRVWGRLRFVYIAQALDVSEETVRSNMHHATAALRRMLGDVVIRGNRRDRTTPVQSPATQLRSSES